MEQYVGQALEIFIQWNTRISIVAHLLNPVILACCQQKPSLHAPGEGKRNPPVSKI